jgi:hypothetical protein
LLTLPHDPESDFGKAGGTIFPIYRRQYIPYRKERREMEYSLFMCE